MERQVFIDWLRAIAVGLVLFFHVGMMFVTWGWHIQNDATIPGLEWLMDLLHRARMPLLFVIAGVVAMFSLRRRAPSLRAGSARRATSHWWAKRAMASKPCSSSPASKRT